MAHRVRLVAFSLVALCSGSAFAGYAQLAPPPGWSGVPGAWKYAPAVNDSVFGKILHSPNGLRVPVPGVSVTMPASYRLAANASRIGSAIIFNNPYVRAGLAIATALSIASVVWDEVSKQWYVEQDSYVPGGNEYRITNNEENRAWSGSKSSACAAEAAFQTARTSEFTYSVTQSEPQCGLRVLRASDGVNVANPTFTYNVKPGNCPGNTVQTPAGCLSKIARPIQQPEFEDKVSPALEPNPEWPLQLPPGSPLPVEEPVINPEPGPNPQPRPLYVPTGDPVPNPNYDPNAAPSPQNQPWNQPGVRITPRPTLDDPWRVDIQPTDRPQPGPEPLPDPDTTPDPNDKPKPEEQKSLCEQHPDIVACQKLGDVTSVPIPNENRAMQITPDSGYGPSNGACPAPRTATIMGVQLSMPFDLICQFASTIRPIVLAFAWLSAALTFFGLGRKDA